MELPKWNKRAISRICELEKLLTRTVYSIKNDFLLSKVRSQISTITMAAFNTTVASFNVGYADFFTEHMKKLCNPVAVPEIPVEPLACANLPRSLTDSCINYSCLEEGENIEGTNNFVLKNGMLDLTVSDLIGPWGQIQLLEVMALFGCSNKQLCQQWDSKQTRF